MPRHPWHPAIVHFPLACWVLATLIDAGRGVSTLFTGVGLPMPGVDPAAASYLLLWTGDAFAAAAIGAGVIDYARLPRELQDNRALLGHIAAMGCAAVLFLSVSLWRAKAPALSGSSAWLAVALELAGTAGLLAGGWLAASVVFTALPQYVQLGHRKEGERSCRKRITVR